MKERDWFYKGNTNDKYKEVFIDIKNPNQWSYPNITMDGYLGDTNSYGRYLVQRPIFKSKTDEEATEKFATTVLNEFGKNITKGNNFAYSYLLNYIKKEMPFDEDDVYNCAPMIFAYPKEDRLILHRADSSNKEYFIDFKRQGDNISGYKVYSQDINMINNSFDDLSWTVRERLEEIGAPLDECNSFNIFEKQDGSMSLEENVVNLTWDGDWILFNSNKQVSSISKDGELEQTETIKDETVRGFCGYAEEDSLCYDLIRDSGKTFHRQGDFVNTQQPVEAQA